MRGVHFEDVDKLFEGALVGVPVGDCVGFPVAGFAVVGVLVVGYFVVGVAVVDFFVVGANVNPPFQMSTLYAFVLSSSNAYPASP